MAGKFVGIIVALGLGLGIQSAGAASLSGAYLAARQAGYQTDFEAAARYYEKALFHDRENPALIEAAAAARLSLGEMDRAAELCEKLAALGHRSQLAQMGLIAAHAKAGRYSDIIAMIEADQGIGPLVDGLLKGWAQLGDGDMTTALNTFDGVAAQKGLAGFAIFHKAMALASVGDFESAHGLLSAEGGGGAQMTRRGIIARVEILSQLGRNTEAAELMDASFNSRLDPGLMKMRAALDGEAPLPFTFVRGPQDGMAEVFYTIGNALAGEAGDDYTLLYTRVTEHLRPDHVDALLLSAQLLEDMDRHELAIATYARVPADHPSYHAAVLGQSDALRAAGRTEDAIGVLQDLTETHGDLPIVHVSLGDVYRSESQYEKAVNAYDTAIKLYDEPTKTQWFVFFTRGIAHERLNKWASAEADFRKALELSPDQPQVLNYLGYSLVEKQEKLEEALAMIERAVAAQPNSGYIVDSLGWVLYRMGRFEDAVGHLERAAELMPIDPVVNDHLGDAYWAVGRELEARFQWHRALSFVKPDDPNNEADPDRIRHKLEVGLDVVLENESKASLEVVANEAD